MNAVTRLSTKGQVVIPKDVREHFHWDANTQLQITKTARGIFLEPVQPKRKTLTWAEFREMLPPPPEGPPATDEDWRKSIEEDIRKRWSEGGC